MSPDGRKKVIEKRNKTKHNRSANQTQQNTNDATSTVAPLTMIVANQATQSVAPSVVTTTSGSPSQAQAHRLLSQADQHPQTIQVDGCTYTLCVANITYQINKHEATLPSQKQNVKQPLSAAITTMHSENKIMIALMVQITPQRF